MPTDDPNPQQSGVVPTSSSFSDVDLSNPTATTAVVENETAMSPASVGTNPTQQPSPPPFKPAPFASVGVVKGNVTAAGTAIQAESRQAELAMHQGASNMRSEAQQAASTAQQNSTATLQREWDRLRQMEEQLQRKEKQLQQRELEIGKNVTQQPNFPKHICCIKPQVYHNINADIIPPRQAFVKRMYFNYYFTCFLIIYQACVDFGALLASNSKDKDDEPAWGEHFGVSMLYLLGIVFAFMLWYWPIYQAASHRVPSKYRMAFLGLVIATLFDVVMAIGFVGHGGCGILFAAAVTDWKDSAALEWMAWIGTMMWVLQGLYFVFSGYRLKKYYDEDLLRSILPTDAAKLQEAVGTAMTVIGAGSGGGRGGRAA